MKPWPNQRKPRAIYEKLIRPSPTKWKVEMVGARLGLVLNKWNVKQRSPSIESSQNILRHINNTIQNNIIKQGRYRPFADWTIPFKLCLARLLANKNILNNMILLYAMCAAPIQCMSNNKYKFRICPRANTFFANNK